MQVMIVKHSLSKLLAIIFYEITHSHGKYESFIEQHYWGNQMFKFKAHMEWRCPYVSDR